MGFVVTSYFKTRFLEGRIDETVTANEGINGFISLLKRRDWYSDEKIKRFVSLINLESVCEVTCNFHFLSA